MARSAERFSNKLVRALCDKVTFVAKSNAPKCQNCDQETETGLSEANSADYKKNSIGQKEGAFLVCTTCSTQCEKRKERTKDIIDLVTKDSKHCLIVAGPGTGKTFTFSEVIQKLPEGSSVLVFTLINNLANDLVEGLSSIKDKDLKINTLHGYCKELLHSSIELESMGKDFTYTAALPELVSHDSLIFESGHSKEDFSAAFAHILTNEAKDFYLSRGSYYNAISHMDSIHHVYSFLSLKENRSRIPQFKIVIVDEYQDFNKLEAEFINLLKSTNLTLIAGDDDQALYGFRNAKVDFIRELFNNDTLGYEKRELPFCSRCSPSIVRATCEFAHIAQTKGRLDGRLPREYVPYWPEKYIEESRYPKINIAKCSGLETVPKLIESKILELTSSDGLDGGDKELSFMVIGPESGFHIQKVKEHLQASLSAEKYEIIGPKEKEDMVILREAYTILSKDANSNLGWRMILHLDPLSNTSEIVSSTKDGIPLADLLPEDYKEKHLTALNATNAEVDEPEENESTKTQKIKILLTNFLGSKGLAAKHVFVVGLNNGTFPQDPRSVKDSEVCRFLVALTRAKRSCTLISNKFYDRQIRRSLDKPSEFLSWLPENELSPRSYKIRDGVVIEG